MDFKLLQALNDSPPEEIVDVVTPVVETEYVIYNIISDQPTKKIGVPSAMVAEFDAYINEHDVDEVIVELERFNAIGL